MEGKKKRRIGGDSFGGAGAINVPPYSGLWRIVAGWKWGRILMGRCQGIRACLGEKRRGCEEGGGNGLVYVYRGDRRNSKPVRAQKGMSAPPDEVFSSTGMSAPPDTAAG